MYANVLFYMYEMNAILSETFLFWFRAVCELYWQATAPNTYHGLFSICHFVHTTSITRKPQGACNSTTHQTTPLLQRMLCLMLKAAKLAVATYKLRSRANIAVLLYCAQVRMTTNLRAPTTVLKYSNNRFPTKVASFRNTNRGTTYELLSSEYHGIFHYM